MKAWTDRVPEVYRVIFFFDTNVLVHLLDNTHQALNDFVEYTGQSHFVDLHSSEYALFEFVNLRKQEYYLRIAADNYERSPTGVINFGQFLMQYNDKEYNIKGTTFDDVIGTIREKVNEDIEKLTRDFNIDVSKCILHREQLDLTFKICLSTKITNKDSLILVSSTILNRADPTQGVIFMTKDSAFVRFANEEKVKRTINELGVAVPNVQNIRGMNLGETLRLTESYTKEQIEGLTRNIILAQIRVNQNSNYLGKSSIPESGELIDGHFYFHVERNRQLPTNAYLTIICKDLDFVYSTKKPVGLFYYSNGSTVPFNTVLSTTSDRSRVYCKIVDIDSEGQDKEIESEVLDAIRVSGNYVFIHPDSFLTPETEVQVTAPAPTV